MKRIKNFIEVNEIDKPPMRYLLTVIGVCVIFAVVIAIFTNHNLFIGIITGVSVGMGLIAAAIIFAMAVMGVRAIIMLIINACRKIFKK